MSLKVLGKNTVIYAIGIIGMRAASFLLIPVYTRTLSVSDYGLLAILLLSIQFMLIFINMGMQTSLLRFAKECEASNRIGDLLGTSSLINVIGGLIVASALFTFLISFFRNVLHTHSVDLYVGMACCAALLQSLSMHIMSYYRARGEVFKYAITGISGAVILSVISLILLCVFKLGIRGALYAYIASYTIILLFVSLDVFSKTGIGISKSLVLKLLQFGLPLIFSMSGELLIGGAGMYLLSYFVGLETVAVYLLGYKLGSLLGMTILLPFSCAFEPYVFTNLYSPNIRQKVSRGLTYLVLAIIFMSFCILWGSRILLPVIAPPEYSSAFLVIVLLLPSEAFRGIYYFSAPLLGAVKKTPIIGITMFLGAILSIILNYTLIPVINFYGAVIALNVSFSLVGSTLLVIGMKKFSVPIEWKRMCVLAGLSVSFFLLFVIMSGVNLILFSLVTLLAILGCIITLFGFGFFYDDEKAAIRTWIYHIRWYKSAVI